MSATKIACIGYQKTGSIHNQAMAVFANRLCDLLPKDVKVELVDDVTVSGRGQFDRPKLVASGEYSIWYQSTSYFTEIGVPGFGVIDLPYIFISREHAFRAMDGKMGKYLTKQAERHTPFKVLGYWDNGFRHLSNSVRPVLTPEDCNGLRVRTLTSPLHGEWFRSLGMTPEIMDIATLIDRSKSGTIDAQDNSLANIWNFGIYEVHRHLTLTGHIWGCVAFMASHAQFLEWPARVRDAVESAAREATAFQRDIAKTEAENLMRTLLKQHAELVRLNETQRQAFVSLGEALVSRHRAAYPKLLDEISSLQ